MPSGVAEPAGAPLLSAELADVTLPHVHIEPDPESVDPVELPPVLDPGPTTAELAQRLDTQQRLIDALLLGGLDDHDDGLDDVLLGDLPDDGGSLGDLDLGELPDDGGSLDDLGDLDTLPDSGDTLESLGSK